MKRVVYNQFGNVDQLTIIETEIPSIKEDNILVKVKAVSINPLDWKIRNGEMKLMSGSKFPKGIGIDFSGIIENVGGQIKEFKAGDAVFGAVNPMKEGALAEFVLVCESAIVLKPQNISFEQAAAMPIVGSAAIQAFDKLASITSGTEVLLNGATGGIGMFAIQIAKQLGARVTAVCGTKGIPFAQKWGSETIIDYSKEDVLKGSKKYDVIFDLTGRMAFSDARMIMKPNAIFINPVPRPIQIISTIIINLFTSQKHKVLISKATRKYLQALADCASKGLDIEVSKTYPMTSYKEAYTEAQKGGVIGKAVFKID
jgi:NADPH:quinone reductase-like Zn-dependent oxidoreductase